MPAYTHKCGSTYSAEDTFCRKCGERIFKVSRDYSEINAEMEAIRQVASEKPNPAFASMAMLMFNVLAWASGEAQTKPTDMLREVEKMTDRFMEGGGGGLGFQPPKPE